MALPPGFDFMLGSCPAMQSLFATIQKVAPTDFTVLVLGETGTGKELVARSLHGRRGHARGPFVALNCAAIPASLLESELFGYERGAFTGAVRDHTGHIERADGGTLFLDEIGEMSPGAQAKLLRVLQDRRVRKLGGTRERQVDVRVVAATHQDLPALVRSRAFRQDLYQRLNEVRLELPPLRDRGDDIDAIAQQQLQRLGAELGRTVTLSSGARAALRAHSWPGNVRELENCLRRAAACARDASIDVGDLRLDGVEAPRSLAQILELSTAAAIRASLRRHAGNALAAATELGVPMAELQRLAARCGVALEEE